MCSDSFGNGTFLLNQSHPFENTDSHWIPVSETSVSNRRLEEKRILQFYVNPILWFLSFPQPLPHFFDEGCFSSSQTSRSLNKQRHSFAPSLLKQLHLPLLMLSEWRSSTDMTLQPNSSSDGSFAKGRGFFYLMYGSSLLAETPLSCLEPCQVLLAGCDAIFLIVNCKKKKNPPKKTTTQNPWCCWTFAVGELLQFSSASVHRTSCGFSSNHMIDSADSLQSSWSV